MDPFTQRMLDRARLRREKMDLEANTVGQTSPTKRSPLKAQEQNQTHVVKITTEEVTISKPRMAAPCPPKPVSPSPVNDSLEEEDESMEEDKSGSNEQMSVDSESEPDENRPAMAGSSIRDDARDRLQRLGALYSDRPSIVSSPIHRTEERFFASDGPVRPPTKAPARTARLAALANTINQWEDDLSHPSIVQQVTIDDEVSPTKQAASAKRVIDNAVSPTKQAVMDKKLMDTLESQGFSRSTSNARLTYAYSPVSPQSPVDGSPASRPPTAAVKEAWLKSTGPASPVGRPSTSWLRPASHSTSNLAGQAAGQAASKSASFLPCLAARSPDKRIATSPTKVNAASPRLGVGAVRGASPEKASQMRAATSVPQMGLKVVSPRKPLENGSPASGSVLHKAQLFEASVSPSKRVDPADLTLVERMALFERNKGEALVPKCAFGLSVHPVPKVFAGAVRQEVKAAERPRQVAQKVEAKQVAQKSPEKCRPAEQMMRRQESVVDTEPSNHVSAQRQMFERGGGRVAHQSIAQAVQTERQKDMAMLLNRWNQNKGEDSEEEMAVETPQKTVPASRPITQVSTPPPPPPLPSSTGISPVKPTPQKYQPQPTAPQQSHPRSASPQKSHLRSASPQKSHLRSASPQKSPQKKAASPVKQYPALGEVKRIKVSPPKPGHIYPCLSDIETATETETECEMAEESAEYNNSSSELESSADGGDMSFGRSILRAVSRHHTPSRRTDSGMSTAESEVVDDMDEFLDDAMGHRSTEEDESEGEGGPTPPKKTRAHKKGDKYKSPTSAPSHSFKYSRGCGEYSSPAVQSGPTSDGGAQSQQAIPTHVEEGGEQVPLMHTVSFYRRQQNMGPKTPVRQVTRQPEAANLDTLERQQVPTDQDNVRRKITALLEEVSKQQTVISQASQALNLCSSTIEFSGSAESVEGERLLLLATHRRQAALNEVQRLKVEGSLKPLTEFGQTVELTEKGLLTVRDIMLPLKKDFIRNLVSDDNVHHFLCLIKSQEQVLATQVFAATKENLTQGLMLVFSNALKLNDLYSDFKVLLEVYALQTRKEMLAHEVKYHINKRDAKGRLTPKKKAESRLMMPMIQSPAGPGAVRSPAFQLAGYVMFSIKELHRTHFALNKVAYTSPLEGQVKLTLESLLSTDTTERGFLTMFEDVSGFGAWHRRWCMLKGQTVSYWKYPDDEKKKVPIGCIDLTACTTRTVDLVSRDICARQNTFLLETTRAAQPGDVDSLVLVRAGAVTTIRHLLSADTREERLSWCSQLNKALSMQRAWSNKRQAE